VRHLTKRLKQFKVLTLTRKVQIVILLLTWIGLIAWAILSWQGRDFPLESELNYSEGIVGSLDVGEGNHIFMLLDLSNLNRKEVYGCSYSAFDTDSSCFGKKYLEPIEGKKAVIGWYIQKDFLGFHNGIRQMVSLNVEDVEAGIKEVITYQGTLDAIKGMNIYVNAGYIIFIAFFSYWFWRFMDFIE
tara:strand:- start:56 stop:616 length:561 start_codon:yes stop_codon:yes gene_type:complete